eukprot:g29855.t1
MAFAWDKIYSHLEAQGSVLGRPLFVVYINDLEENVADLISKFADVQRWIELRTVRKLTFIGRGIEYKDRQIILQLSRNLVRPHLEYCVQFWSPHYQKDVDASEEVMEADKIAAFKKLLDEYMNGKGIEGYGF